MLIAGDEEGWTITEADRRKRTRGAARISRFKTRQSLACRFVNVAEIIDYYARSQTNPATQNELRRKAWRAFVRSVEIGFFEHDGTRRTKPQLRIWAEGGMPRRVDTTGFRDIIVTFYEDSVDDYTGCIWLPIAAVLRWCADQRIEPKQAWVLAAQVPADESVSPEAPKEEVNSKPNGGRRNLRRPAVMREKVKNQIVADIESGGTDWTEYTTYAAAKHYGVSEDTFILARDELTDEGAIAAARERHRAKASKSE